MQEESRINTKPVLPHPTSHTNHTSLCVSVPFSASKHAARCVSRRSSEQQQQQLSGEAEQSESSRSLGKCHRNATHTVALDVCWCLSKCGQREREGDGEGDGEGEGGMERGRVGLGFR